MISECDSAFAKRMLSGKATFWSDQSADKKNIALGTRRQIFNGKSDDGLTRKGAVLHISAATVSTNNVLPSLCIVNQGSRAFYEL